METQGELVSGWSTSLYQLAVFEDETHVLSGISLKSMQYWQKMAFINNKLPSSFWYRATAKTLARLKNCQRVNRINKSYEQIRVLKVGDSGSYRFIMNPYKSPGSQTLVLSLASIITDMAGRSSFPVLTLQTFASTVS